jgi:recombinational DNA repair ATPase RecF
MLIRKIELTHFRGVERREVAFDAGVNLVVGPNESGKSTLVQALRFGLFESHKGQAEHKKSLQSWYDTGSPQVAIEFEVAGTAYRIEKHFLKKEMARLSGGGRTWVDAEAETELHRLLDAVPADGRGGRRPRDDAELGLWPLLLVMQGSAGLPPHQPLNDRTRERLGARLAAEVGEVVAGRRGAALLEAARRERDRYFTESRGQARGDLAAAEARLAAAEEALARAVARREAMRGAADRVVEESARLEALEDRLRKLDLQCDAAERRVAEVRALDEQRRVLAERCEHRRASLREASQRAAARAEHERDRAAIEADHRRAGDAVAAAQAALEAAEAEERREGEAARAAEDALEAAVRRVRSAQRALDRTRLWAELAKVARRLEEAVAAHERALDVAARLEAHPATPAALRALREAAARRDTLRAQLEGVAARVTIRARASVEVDGERLAAGERREWLCTEPRRFALPGVEVEVAPGGTDLGKRADALRDAERALTARLQALGIADLAAAEDAEAERRRLERERQDHQTRLEVLAPEGIDALRTELRAAQQRWEAVAPDPGSEVEAAGAGSSGPDGASDERARAALEEAFDAARAAEDAARRSLADARGRRDAASGRVARLRGERDEATRRERELAGRLAALVQQIAELEPAEVLDEAVRRAADALREVEGELAAVEEARRAAGAEGAREELEALKRSRDQLRREESEARQARTRAETELRAMGGEGLHDAVQQAEAEREEAAAERARVRARAEAARRLAEVLEAARQGVQQRLAAPVERKVRPYLEDLFGAARLDLDDAWAVRGLRSGDVAQGFDDLSGGAREQLGVVVRLALAEVLAAGEPLPVVLDDALVNTDRRRQEAMLRVLRRAGRTLQVIVLTCHEEAFDGLGAATKTVLEPLRAARRALPAG